MSNTVVNTNVLAINSHRNLTSVGNLQSKASQRLSSGLRVNSAADDAAGLAISEKMRAQIRGLDQASSNAQDGINLIQTAEGGMQEIQNMLQRVRELVDKAANDTNDYKSDDRQKIQDEINSLVSEIDSMKERTEFNNKKIINGSSQNQSAAKASVSIAIAKKTSDLADIATNKLNPVAYDKINDGGSITAILAEAGVDSAQFTDVATVTGALTSLAAYDTMLEDIEAGLEMLKSNINVDSKYQDAYTALSDLKTGLMEHRKTFASKEMLTEQYNSLTDTNARSLYLQVGANTNQSIMVSIGSIDSKMMNIGDGAGGTSIDVVQESGLKISGYLDQLDSALSYVATQRSALGATQNRLEYTVNSLDISSENLSAAESRIRDTDMAKEMMNLTKANVLQQAATSMLAQANQAPQNVLQLLQ